MVNLKRAGLTLVLLLGLASFASDGRAQGCGANNPNCVVPTAPTGTSNNQAASTAFVQGAVSAPSHTPGGSSGQVQFNNAGSFGGLTNAQLTALINPATALLSGALPAWPNNTSTFFRGDGSYVTLNCAALAGVAPSCGTDTTNASNISSGTLAAARGGAGTINGALRGNGAGVVSQAATANLSDVTAPTSWTPADNSGAALTFTGVSANYTKIGNMVFAYAQLTYPATANGNSANISGFPVAFPASNYGRQCSLSISTVATLVYVEPAASSAAIALANSGSGAITNATMSGGTIAFICIYPAS